jgi:hypothetical protein
LARKNTNGYEGTWDEIVIWYIMQCWKKCILWNFTHLY